MSDRGQRHSVPRAEKAIIDIAWSPIDTIVCAAGGVSAMAIAGQLILVAMLYGPSVTLSAILAASTMRLLARADCLECKAALQAARQVPIWQQRGPFAYTKTVKRGYYDRVLNS
ncbi:MAG: hypothetical protein EOS38_05600 [Mesorhizobium sp.]|nr:hypothetical protein EOA38_02745 [Mesorhizobium sp. M1E.F.Ca.ET.041.01.1.1]RWD91330.1 MAG: hypothetical protein EOS38_05600 [Mesorhizobium sp.]RWD94616.1 MAG: hypothetical protein EOS39_06055 [Mesorhizobium sp.]